MAAVFIIVGAFIIVGFIIGFLQSNRNSEDPANAEMEEISSINHQYNSQEVNTRKETGTMENPKYNTKELMVSTLTQIGCQPSVNEDDTVTVTYQGEHFNIMFGGFFAQIWDLGWASVNAHDPELPKIQEAMNNTNFNFGPTVVMTVPDKDGNMYFHSRLDILLHPDIPDKDNYLRTNLDMFFHTKENFRQNYQKLNIEQQKIRESRRPVGFTSANESPEVTE